MSNISQTNIDNIQTFVSIGDSRDDVFVEAGAGKVYPAGTALGRVTASGKLAPFASGASNGTQNIVTVLSYDLDTTAGAADYPIRRPNSAVMRKDKLIEDGVGAITTQAVIDTLNANGISVIDSIDVTYYDNAV